MNDQQEQSPKPAMQRPDDIRPKEELAKIHGSLVGSAKTAGIGHYMTRDDLETAEQAARLLSTIISRQPQVRSISLARTHLDECVLWLRFGHTV